MGSYLPSGFLPKNKRSHFKSDVSFSSSEPLLYQMIDIRKEKKRNNIIVTVGDPRTGKSAFDIKTCEILAKKWNCPFGIDNIHYDVDDFLEDMIKGSPLIIMEEGGKLLSSKSWWDMGNKIVVNAGQTQGFRLNTIFINLPSFAFLDKSIRFLCNFGVKTIEAGKVDVFKINVDHMQGEGYFTRLERIEFEMPTQSLWDQYSEKKRVNNDVWLEQDIINLQYAKGKITKEEALSRLKALGVGGVEEVVQEEKPKLKMKLEIQDNGSYMFIPKQEMRVLEL